jgi:hypothetical protein
VNDFIENHSILKCDKCEAVSSAHVSDEQLSVNQVMVLVMSDGAGE